MLNAIEWISAPTLAFGMAFFILLLQKDKIETVVEFSVYLMCASGIALLSVTVLASRIILQIKPKITQIPDVIEYLSSFGFALIVCSFANYLCLIHWLLGSVFIVTGIISMIICFYPIRKV